MQSQAHSDCWHVKHGEDAGVECQPAELVVIAPLAPGGRRAAEMYRAAIHFVCSGDLPTHTCARAERKRDRAERETESQPESAKQGDEKTESLCCEARWGQEQAYWHEPTPHRSGRGLRLHLAWANNTVGY
jgi:hypothetical protein